MTDTADKIKHSVTAGDYTDSPYTGAGVYYLMAPSSYARPIADLQGYWTVSRDFQLRATVMMEAMWAASVFKAITKRAARGFEVSDPADQQITPDGRPKLSRRTTQSQGLLLSAQPGHGTPGWVPFLSKQLRDFLTTDNGSFIEIIRASSAAGSKIIGLAHLDGVRCRRTGDSDIPVLYRDRKGAEHELQDYQVLTFSDMPDPGDTYYGVGLCAASRSYGTIAKLAAVERYVYEKVSGTRALAIHFVSGVNDKQLQGALRVAEETQLQKGVYTYMGALIVSMLGDVVPQVATVPLSELPDGFDAEKERDNAYLVYANNIGVAVQDVKPLSGQGLGTGTQTQVLDDAQEAMGLAAYDKQLEHALNEYVLPATTTVHFMNMHDMRDQKLRAEVGLVRAQDRSTRIQSGEIDPPIARQLAADSGDLPPELLPRDETAQGDLADDEKPYSGPYAISPLAAGAPQTMPSKGGDSGATPAPRPQAVKATMKGADDTGVMIALYPDAAAAQQLAAQPGVTEPIQEIHLTLAFLGDSSEAPLETNRDRLTQAVQDWAAEHGQPLKGIINGLGRFFHSEADGTNAVFVSPDVPGLPELRQSLCDWIERSGFDYAQNHGFTPHLTVAYVPEDAPTPPIRVEIPVTFDRVSLVWGSERTDYPMGTVAATKAHSPLARRLHDKATLARAKKLYEEALTSAE